MKLYRINIEFDVWWVIEESQKEATTRLKDFLEEQGYDDDYIGGFNITSMAVEGSDLLM